MPRDEYPRNEYHEITNHDTRMNNHLLNRNRSCWDRRGWRNEYGVMRGSLGNPV